MSNFESLVALPPSADPTGRWYVVGTGATVLVDSEGAPPQGARSPVETAEPPIFMGLLDGLPTWAVGTDESSDAPGGFAWQPLIDLGAQLDTAWWMLAGRAVQLVEWARTSRFCGRCRVSLFRDRSRKPRNPRSIDRRLVLREDNSTLQTLSGLQRNIELAFWAAHPG